MHILRSSMILVAGLLIIGTTIHADAPPYTVVDGTRVDSATYAGYKTWKIAGCARCHGGNQEGLVGPSLIERLAVLSKADFMKVINEGRIEKGMPSFATNKSVSTNADGLYAYLKGRSDGKITAAAVEEIQ